MSVIDHGANHQALVGVSDADLPTAAARFTRSHRAALATAGRFAVVALTVAGVLAAADVATMSIPATVVAAAIWFIALRTVYASAWLSPLAVGTRVASALGATVGLAGMAAAATLVPGMSELTPAALVAAAGGIAITSAAYELLAERWIAPRRRLLVIGSGAGGTDVVGTLREHPELPFDCIGLVDDAENSRYGVVGGVADLPAIVGRERPDLVVVAGVGDRNRVIQLLFDAAPCRFQVVGVHHFYEHAFGRVPLEDLSAAWFMSILHLYRRPYSRLSKRAFDLSFAVVGLILAAPLIPAIALLVRLSSRGPALFRQVRLGEGGRRFEIYKFRTMVADAEHGAVAVWASADDPRITRVGRVLRRTRLDELPQLWNVLRGDMSIVGPRPERPEFLEQLAEDVPFWARRHLVKPGITGWAQLRCGYTSDSRGAAEKLSYDLYYLKHRSLLLDLAITAKTAAVVATGSGAR